MPWLLLLFAIGALVVAFSTKSVAVAVIALLLSLVLVVLWVLGLMAQRVGNQSRSEALMVDPAELRRLREQAEARRNGGAAPPEPRADA
ncbi:hypothetical protein LDO26_06920 [Luteimonas sp. BDR2-5]|uniref:hypothetical protein n=1 Tax=Proluteimonas luteida TaxID=2878685 RepID=UPI001E35262A|nr:hypothetical protein [Luteimonas sp. BDR2-5]MCD9027937.1 hypothetical protein [Luteimonas sp. BDR2-5]